MHYVQYFMHFMCVVVCVFMYTVCMHAVRMYSMYVCMPVNICKLFMPVYIFMHRRQVYGCMCVCVFVYISTCVC